MRGLLLAVLALLLVAGDSGRYPSQLVYNVVQVYPANKKLRPPTVPTFNLSILHCGTLPNLAIKKRNL